MLQSLFYRYSSLGTEGQTFLQKVKRLKIVRFLTWVISYRRIPKDLHWGIGNRTAFSSGKAEP
jgi:hypothetical protein